MRVCALQDLRGRWLVGREQGRERGGWCLGDRMGASRG